MRKYYVGCTLKENFCIILIPEQSVPLRQKKMETPLQEAERDTKYLNNTRK